MTMIRSTFEPHLTLMREPDGEYTLHAVTIAPNSCYGAGRAARGVPPTVLVLPEVEPVVLHITHRKGMCLQVLTPVRHHVPNLKLGPSHGKTTLTAFAMIGDAIVGSTGIDVSNLGSICPGPGYDKPLPISTSDWNAWINRMPRVPPGPSSFHVTGLVLMPTPGYDVKLVPAAPQGINPRDLILDLVIDKKRGTWPQVVTPIPVRYDQESAGGHESVLVRLPDGTGIPLSIESVF
jgi:hypothetical protein